MTGVIMSEVRRISNIWCEHISADEKFENYDSLLILTSRKNLNLPCSPTSLLPKYLQNLLKYREVDNAFNSDVSFIFVDGSPIKRLIHSPVLLQKDYDDIRSFGEAACKGVKRVIKSGGKKLLVVIPSSDPVYKSFDVTSILGAYHALYVPVEIRDDIPARMHKLDKIGVINTLGPIDQKCIQLAQAIESGRVVCRDIGGSDPEKMAPPRVADYVQNVFSNTCIKIHIIRDEAQILKQYPLLAAVDRATIGIDRHRACVIILTYEPEGPCDSTLFLVGKGVTYDTGGADVKHGGHMASMHRDKCGAAAVAGFMQVLATLKPKGIKVVGAMSMVRNSIGPNCYVSDEIITSRAGKRVRIGNTDAEGRMAMGDVLCHMKELAVNEKNPYLFTIATLTGHAVLTVGEDYSIILDNGPAKVEGVGSSIQKAGEEIGDPFEVSTLRREDYEFHQGKSEYEDLLQCNNLPSSQTCRGHQTPAAFLSMVSGLDEHGCTSEKPLKYCHIDIAGSSGPYPGIPTGAPIPALTERFIRYL